MGAMNYIVYALQLPPLREGHQTEGNVDNIAIEITTHAPLRGASWVPQDATGHSYYNSRPSVRGIDCSRENTTSCASITTLAPP